VIEYVVIGKILGQWGRQKRNSEANNNRAELREQEHEKAKTTNAENQSSQRQQKSETLQYKVLPLTDNPERYNTLKTCFIERGGVLQKYDVEKARKHNELYVLSLNAFSQQYIDPVEVGSLIKIPITDVLPPESDTYYYFQLEGLTVETDDNRLIGTVKEIIKTGSCDVFIIEGEKEYLVPFIEDIVKTIDLHKRKIVIYPMEGLLD
jgi:16S rRNA processing protein RimM